MHELNCMIPSFAYYNNQCDGVFSSQKERSREARSAVYEEQDIPAPSAPPMEAFVDHNANDPFANFQFRPAMEIFNEVEAEIPSANRRREFYTFQLPRTLEEALKAAATVCTVLSFGAVAPAIVFVCTMFGTSELMVFTLILSLIGWSLALVACVILNMRNNLPKSKEPILKYP